MFEPGRTISSVITSGSTPGGMKRTVRANLAAASEAADGGVVELDEEAWRLREMFRGGEEEREKRESGLGV